MPTVFRDIATGAGTNPNTDDRFALPTRGVLTWAAIGIHFAAQGPIRLNISIELENDIANRHSLTDARWLRGDTSFGVRETAQWNGEIQLGTSRARLLVLGRNDTGSTVTYRLSWSVKS